MTRFPTGGLRQTASREKLVLEIAKHEKSVNAPFYMAYRYLSTNRAWRHRENFGRDQQRDHPHGAACVHPLIVMLASGPDEGGTLPS